MKYGNPDFFHYLFITKKGLPQQSIVEMDRIFKIAGDFLESVDQRADRSVNCTFKSAFLIHSISTNFQLQDTVFFKRTVENSVSDFQSTANASTLSPNRDRNTVSSQVTLLLLFLLQESSPSSVKVFFLFSLNKTFFEPTGYCSYERERSRSRDEQFESTR